ncbi:MAG TPA: hypothetical protein VN663_22880 [Ramlibacter sp.]|nr:hypothetical protein [Ramlibacter sp.]
MTYPIYVCVPQSAGQINDFAGAYPRPEPSAINPAPLGVLAGISMDGCDKDMIERDLGMPVRIYGAGVQDGNGCFGAMLLFVVEAPTLTAARALPGFQPLGIISEAVYLVPEGLFDDDIPKWGECVRRALPAGYPLPPFETDGAFIASAIPYGQIADAVFLQDDPRSIYLMSCLGDRAEKIAIAQRNRRRDADGG